MTPTPADAVRIDLLDRGIIRLLPKSEDSRQHYAKSVGRTSDGREIVLRLGLTGQIVGIEIR